MPLSADAIVSEAPLATKRGIMSEIGEAVTRLPPRHATFRICLDANQRSMSPIARHARPRTPAACSPPAAQRLHLRQRRTRAKHHLFRAVRALDELSDGGRREKGGRRVGLEAALDGHLGASDDEARVGVGLLEQKQVVEAGRTPPRAVPGRRAQMERWKPLLAASSSGKSGSVAAAALWW